MEITGFIDNSISLQDVTNCTSIQTGCWITALDFPACFGVMIIGFS